MRSVRFLTQTALFDGHDVSINIIRRMLMASGAEVVHLAHNRSVREIVQAAIQENVDGVAVSSYQGGHVEFFKFLVDELARQGAAHVKVFGGGGGVFSIQEIEELHSYGVSRVFSPEDGQKMGLQGMIELMISLCGGKTISDEKDEGLISKLSNACDNDLVMGKLMSQVSSGHLTRAEVPKVGENNIVPCIGFTGTGGSGKSTLEDELLRRLLVDTPDNLKIAVLAADPAGREGDGCLLGDRLRFNTLRNENSAKRLFFHSFSHDGTAGKMSEVMIAARDVCVAAGFGLVAIETPGIGQIDTGITDVADLSVYVMTPEYGAESQLEKLRMLGIADLVVLNKYEKQGGDGALMHVRKAVQRYSKRFHDPLESMMVFPTVASAYDDSGTALVFLHLLKMLHKLSPVFPETSKLCSFENISKPVRESAEVVPPARLHYLAEITSSIRKYRGWARRQADLAGEWQSLVVSSKLLTDEGAKKLLEVAVNTKYEEIDPTVQKWLATWDDMKAKYDAPNFEYSVRNKKIVQELQFETLSGIPLKRVFFPEKDSSKDKVTFLAFENVPGVFPFTSGVFPLKRRSEEPTRLVVGEGGPERSNRRLHYLQRGMLGHRLSSVFDAITLYGANPSTNPDNYGKIGNSGASICTLDGMKKLYSGFNLCAADTSLNLTINGPSPIVLAFYMNTCIDQQVELRLRERGEWDAIEAELKKRLGEKRPVYVPYDSGMPEGHDGTGLGLLGTSAKELVEMGLLQQSDYDEIRAWTFKNCRGTVQADVFKEEQAQNSCIFSLGFALRLVGDVQNFFVKNEVRNFYSVSVSGYHIAEAGANPITQIAFSLANGFTFLEFFKSRGLDVNQVAHNLSFFFSCGMDAEYSVLGRVARRIWAVALRDVYGASERCQKLKYHIQTSGRSLQAQDCDFNDPRTTLQALMAIEDNCNSLHTNSYDEAFTTPTEESVRRAIAIQLIINRELGVGKFENALQGSFAYEQLTSLVEDAVLNELDRLNERGGVVGAMEYAYQRSRIQDQSLQYESGRNLGKIPVVGFNEFLRSGTEPSRPSSLSRASDEEKNVIISDLRSFETRNVAKGAMALQRLKDVVRNHGNVFSELLDTVLYCSLGQITDALYEVGGTFRCLT